MQALRFLVLCGVAAIGLTLGLSVSAQTSADPQIKPAIDAIFEAFDSRPIVGLGDRHGLANGAVFYEELIRNPRFARDVGNVVVEFGGALHQDVIDRYVNGEHVPYTELRRVWTDTIGWFPVMSDMYYAHFFYFVRELNLTLPPEQRIRIWLGDPPADWDEIETRDQAIELLLRRDAHVATILGREILGEDKKALIIYGASHFGKITDEEIEVFTELRNNYPDVYRTIPRSVQKLVEEEHPDTFHVVQVYIGFGDQSCTEVFERQLRNWSLPTIATPVIDTSLEDELRECLPPIEPSDLGAQAEQWPEFLRTYAQNNPADHRLFRGDAILFLAPAAELVRTPLLPDFYMDLEYQEEISRRQEIMVGRPLEPVMFLPLDFRFLQRD